MSKIDEAILKIDEMIGHMIGPFGEEPECTELRSIKKLLESEPEPGEFTKDFRHTLGLGPKTRSRTARIVIMGLTACDRIDRLTAENRERKRQEDAAVYYAKNQHSLAVRTSAENKDLKESLKADSERIVKIVKLEAEFKQNKFLLEHGPAALLKAKDENIQNIKNGLLKLSDDLDSSQYAGQNVGTDEDRQQWKGEQIMIERMLKVVEQALKE